MHDVEVRESRIQGRGVFAVSDIPAGALIRRYNIVREVTAASPIEAEPGERIEHCTHLGDRVLLGGPPDCFFNHSCDPNAYKRVRETAIELAARRAIPRGSEITHDYLINTHAGSTWTCRCVSVRCRGNMPSSFFDLPKTIQIEYLPLLADWFVARHPRRIQELRAEACFPTSGPQSS